MAAGFLLVAVSVALSLAPLAVGAYWTVTLHDFFGAFTEAGFTIERFEELGDRDYPHIVGLRAQR